MHVAGEAGADFKLAAPAIRIPEMVDGFAHTATAELAEQFYGQAFQMVSFLQGLCRGGARCVRDWVGKLHDGAPPSTFFESTILELAPSAQVPPLTLWQMYFDGLPKSDDGAPSRQ